MKITLTFLSLLLCALTARSQSDTVTNSFEEDYKKTNPAINYSYDNLRQTHNYSNNWDFDLDGKTDQVYFVGTGGVHLYYFLRIVLSTDNVKRDYPFMRSDLPVLPPADTVEKSDFNPISTFTSLAVFDYDKDKINDIFIRLDNSSFLSNKKTLRKYNIQSNYVVITFKDRKVQFEDYSDAGK